MARLLDARGPRASGWSPTLVSGSGLFDEVRSAPEPRGPGGSRGEEGGSGPRQPGLEAKGLSLPLGCCEDLRRDPAPVLGWRETRGRSFGAVVNCVAFNVKQVMTCLKNGPDGVRVKNMEATRGRTLPHFDETA